MRKTILAVGATFALAATAMGAFPSPWNPAGKNASDVTQYIALTWDDNAYSGASGTEYEWRTSPTAAQTANFVSGQAPSWITGSPNAGNLVGFTDGTYDNTLGMAWAYRALAKGQAITASGPQNSGIPMTFNMITGLYVDREDGTWDNAQSVLGSFVPSVQESPPAAEAQQKGQATNHLRIGVTWGREHNTKAGGAFDINQINEATKLLRAAGSEIGNHTIDHMESNTPLVGGNPRAAQFTAANVSAANNREITIAGKTWKLGFENWGNEGFAPQQMNEMIWGFSVDEAKEFGQTVGHTAQSRGWLIYAGQQLSEESWYQYIKFSEAFLTGTATGVSSPQIPVSEIKGFRAPRLEVNSAMFFALKRGDYLYECGVEDGYEWHRTGPNFLWPYDMANGVQNSWTQFSSGNRVHLDSTPDGFWQIPSTPVVVPEDIRPAVWDNHEAIMKGAGTPEGVDAASKAHWLKHGKITGFDFNTWILYGMSADNWQKTMQNTLNMRLNGNKAPMQFGMHTDYYTPMYDNATLLTDFNKNGWGLPVVRGWNTWKDRQRQTEAFVNYALTQGAEFVTGAQLIEKVKALAAEGEAKASGTLTAGLPNDWEFIEEDGSTSNTTSLARGDLKGEVNIKSTNAAYQPRYVLQFDAGTLSSATHISLSYKQSSAAMLRLVLEDGTIREVMLAHRFPLVSNDNPTGAQNNNYASAALRSSGMIPIAAFDFPPSTETPMNYSAVDVSKVVAIEIQPLAPYAEPLKYGVKGWSNKERDTDWNAKFEFSNLTVHTGTPFDFTVPPENNVKPNPQPDDNTGSNSIAKVTRNNARSLSLAGITNNELRLNITKSGKFDVSIYTANGRLVQSFKAQELTTGINSLRLNNFAKGVYIIKVQGINNNQSLAKSALIM